MNLSQARPCGSHIAPHFWQNLTNSSHNRHLPGIDGFGSGMAPNARIIKVDLQINDMDRNYYQAHALTLAQHPSETDLRAMVRLLAFALYADPRLEFGKGLSTEDEPDLWQKDMTGRIERWIEVGQPDEARLRKASGRAEQVVVLNYSGRGADLWWEKNSPALERIRNLTVLDLPSEVAEAIARDVQRNMQVQCFIQDGHLQWLDRENTIDVVARRRMAPQS
jgi:uncharacterized protein YaeQ